MPPSAPPSAPVPRWTGVREFCGEIRVHRIRADLQAPQGLPEPGTVEVWYVPVEGGSRTLPFSLSPASADDLERARRFRNEAGRTRFLSARRALRSLLAAYLSAYRTDWVLSTDRRGKPYVAIPSEGDPPISFNMAHSGEWVSLAFCTRRAVGIDLEKEGTLPDLDALARHTLSGEELGRFSHLPPALRHPFFFQAWTRKEAFLKAMGIGLSLSPGQAPTGLGPEETVLRISTETETEGSDSGSWTVASIPAPPGYAAAVSFQGSEVGGVRIRVLEGPGLWLVSPRSTHGP